jgi:glycosyltransferase involved in cell wall biosynthesis
MSFILEAIAILGTALWCASIVRGVMMVKRTVRFSDVPAVPPKVWPRLSVLVPACNEGATIEAALATLCAQDYPELEIVVVDDRSTDETGAIIDRAAAKDPRVVAVHVKELPKGWLGKVHALAKGLERTSGELVLFTDADIHFGHDALRRAVAAMEARALDHLALLPKMEAEGLLYEAVLAGFGAVFLQSTRLDLVGKQGSDAYVGVGAFNLVRKSALDRSEGFEWIRMEVGDDVGLALLLKRAGARAAAWLATDDLKVVWYPTLGDMIVGLEKNSYGIMGHYRVSRIVAHAALGLAIFACPFVLLALEWPWGALGLAALAAASIANAALVSRKFAMRPLPIALAPLTVPLLIFIGLRSMWYCVRQGGITWRGTFYPVEELRAAQRVRL